MMHFLFMAAAAWKTEQPQHTKERQPQPEIITRKLQSEFQYVRGFRCFLFF